MKDEKMPNGDWQFDQSVADVFPDMLKRSIPNYEWMRESTSRIISAATGNRHLDILDIGCSDGQEYLQLCADGVKVSNYIGLDCSEPMIEKAEKAYVHGKVVYGTRTKTRQPVGREEPGKDKSFKFTIKEAVKGIACYLKQISSFLSAAASKVRRPIPETEWLWDTGASVDIVPRSALVGAEKYITPSNAGLAIQTAGGLIRRADKEVVLTTNSLDEKAFRAIVMDSSPSALSAGW